MYCIGCGTKDSAWSTFRRLGRLPQPSSPCFCDVPVTGMKRWCCDNGSHSCHPHPAAQSSVTSFLNIYILDKVGRSRIQALPAKFWSEPFLYQSHLYRRGGDWCVHVVTFHWNVEENQYSSWQSKKKKKKISGHEFCTDGQHIVKRLWTSEGFRPHPVGLPPL